MFWIGCLRGARSVSSFCDFQKIPSGFHRIFLIFDTRKSCFFQIFLLRSIKAYLCPNINFDSVDFSERRSEEVIFLLTLSVEDNTTYTIQAYSRLIWFVFDIVIKFVCDLVCAIISWEGFMYM